MLLRCRSAGRHRTLIPRAGYRTSCAGAEFVLGATSSRGEP